MVLLTEGVVSSLAQSALDGFDPNANGFVRAIVVQPDGKILIGGDFTSVAGVTRNHIARLNADGTLDAVFDPNADDLVLTIALQWDGELLGCREPDQFRTQRNHNHRWKDFQD